MSEEQNDNNSINQADIDAINKDIEDATNTLVSKETEEKIAKAKEEAKKEAEKEFLVNQRVKELEAEKQKLQEQMEAKEREAAERLASLNEKVNKYVESKTSINNENPFNGNNNSNNVESLSDDDVNNIEQESYQAFVEHRIRKP